MPWSIYKIIYSFHIPLFVFLSGYFTKRTDPKFGRSLLNLFLLYVIFSLISWGVKIIVYQKPAFDSVFQTPFALWYILCLIYWKTIIHYTPEPILKNWWFLIVALGISVLPLFIMLDYFSLARCIFFFPYFLLGWLSRKNNWIEKLNERIVNHIPPRQRIGYLLFMIVMAMICCYVATKIPSGFYWGLKPVEQPIIFILGCKLLTFVIAVVNSLAVYLLMPKKKGLKEGQYTLFYYLYHTILLFPVFDLIVKRIPNTFLTSLAVLASVMLLLFLMRKIKYLNKLLAIGKDKPDEM